VGSATRSPNVEPAAVGAGQGESVERPRRRPGLIPGRLRRLGPKTLQSRLALGFAGVVALTLFLVTVFVLNRLDDQFRRQQHEDLLARMEIVAQYVDALASDKAGSAPVISADNVVNADVAAALRSRTYRDFMADQLAQADLNIALGRLPLGDGDVTPIVPAIDGVFQMSADTPSRPGLTKESLVAEPLRRIATLSPFPYVIEVRLSNPYTFRQVTIDNVTTIAAAVGAVASGWR
jgi:hypothetical protein